LLFRKNIEPACVYCIFAHSGEEDAVICPKHGIRQPWQQCRRFRYDPLRRLPETEPSPVLDVDPEEFRL